MILRIDRLRDVPGFTVIGGLATSDPSGAAVGLNYMYTNNQQDRLDGPAEPSASLRWSLGPKALTYVYI